MRTIEPKPSTVIGEPWDPKEGARLIPETDAERAVLKALIERSIPDHNIEPTTGQGFRGKLRAQGEWDEDGYLHGALIIEPVPFDPLRLMDVQGEPVRFWITAEPVVILWELDSPYTLGKQSNYLPYLPVIGEPSK